MFLSTPPSRVATKPAFFLGCEDVVSIHATLAGGDSASRCRPRRTARVSIHATLAGGDWRRRHERKRICVSIHATLAGGDHKLLCHRPAVLVSIHATLAGGDSAETLVMSIYQQFLSTPPSRVATRQFISAVIVLGMFLSTPPSRVATLPVTHMVAVDHVSIHATLAGGDHGGRLGECARERVSIHATLAGGDGIVRRVNE